jgi:hypothetical protein
MPPLFFVLLTKQLFDISKGEQSMDVQLGPVRVEKAEACDAPLRLEGEGVAVNAAMQRD